MKVIVTHSVDDVQHWFDSPQRERFFSARGMTCTAFRDPSGATSKVAVLIETPDMASLEAALADPAAAEAETKDGVHVDTFQMYVDG